MKKWTFIIALGAMFFLQGCKKEISEISQDREEAVMRKIGHNILLSAGNQISLVKPIIKEENQYRIQFDADFGFPPEGIAVIIDSVLRNSHIKKNYLVKVEACNTSEVVYSYEVDVFSSIPMLDGLACRERPQPKACYEVVIQFLNQENARKNSSWIFYILFVVLLIIGIITIRKKKSKAQLSKDKIKLGDYLYDPKKMVLIRQEKTIELTSKENELLSLLNEFANETVNKETILNKVWGDEGDYVGRTLDVYVSKLRKKLENDSSIELKNIRGVGYKLIIAD